VPRFPDEIPVPLFEKLRLKKQEDGYSDKPWNFWFRYLTRDISLEQSPSEILTGATRENLAKLWMKNFAENMQMILATGKISQIPKAKKPVLIVGAGPSVQAKGHLGILFDWLMKDSKNRAKIEIIATDRMLIPLINKGIAPEYAITVDGNREKIIKWYDDPVVHAGTLRGVILSNTVAPNVAQLMMQKNIDIFWFTAMLDSFQLPTNVTRLIFYMTDAAAVNCGGNAGTAGWAVANYLDATQVGLIGLDFGYLEGTPLEQTAYYAQLEQVIKSNPFAMNGFYFEDFNPDFGVKCYSDVMFKHYKAGFLEMLTLSKTPTFNCTEGGILYGTGIRGIKFEEWLNSLPELPEQNNGHQ
jgi:hypothetical protein